LGGFLLITCKSFPDVGASDWAGNRVRGRGRGHIYIYIHIKKCIYDILKVYIGVKAWMHVYKQI